VGAIAVVHETLSQSFEEAVEFDTVADQLISLVSEVGAHDGSVRLRRDGSFGTLSSEAATPLAMVLTEVLQNAMEHGFPDGRSGTVQVQASTSTTEPEPALVIRVVDDGVGLPTGFDPATSTSLGLSIVRSLVAELGGTLRIGPRADGVGTAVEFAFPR
jgi:two-component sensor histidine kinase